MNTPHKHAEVLRAIADGKEVQFSHMHTTLWHDMTAGGTGYDPLANESLFWRVKPVENVRYVNVYTDMGHESIDKANKGQMGFSPIGMMKVTTFEDGTYTVEQL